MTARPSEIRLVGIIPLVDTFGRTEREVAAAVIVRACARNGDAWQAVDRETLLATVRADVAERVEPLVHLAHNPFARPNFSDLAEAGFATIDTSAGSVELTPAAIDLLSAKWGPRP